ncbi:MAG: hypothetical protein ACE5E6_11475, partial [Phycisphaerae bacterium]
LPWRRRTRRGNGGPIVSKTVPPSLTALGRRSLPSEIEVRGCAYTLTRIFKNDFFAITALFERSRSASTHTDAAREGPRHHPDGGRCAGSRRADDRERRDRHDGPERVILKVAREADFMMLPLAWVGRILAKREVGLLTVLDGLEGVPRLIARWGRTGIVREYVDGTPLVKGHPPPDDFHERLRSLVASVHARGVAVVDLEKPENVLVGADGGPHLFDFQISWYWPKRWGGESPPLAWLRARLQAADRYHLVKLQRRTRPDQLAADVVAASYRKPWPVRAFTTATRPITRLRRVMLNRAAPKRPGAERGQMHEQRPLPCHPPTEQ